MEDSIDCWEQVTIALNNALKGLANVDYSFQSNNSVNLNAVDLSAFYASLPRVDGILFWGIPERWLRYERKRIRKATGCNAIITICWRAIRKDSDWCFSFTDAPPSTTRICGPVWKALYRHSVKRPKTVLIDHWTQDTQCDWTYQIEEWLQDIATEFQISRYVQRENKENILPYLKPMYRAPFMQWLAETDDLETFVVTHIETYGYAILDMFARGVRVVSPTPLVPAHFKYPFCVDTFNSKDELIDLLRTPPDPVKLSKNRAALTDWSEVVKLIDDRFRQLLAR